MKQHTPIVLHKHRLSHIPDLKVEDDFLEKKFSKGCSMQNCNAHCCRHGVMIDPLERDRILDNVELIRKYMQPHQEQDPNGWFDEEDEKDADFPSGRTIGTQTRDYGCVFLDKQGLCVLQKAAMAEGLPKFSIKPFFCIAFPVTIEDGVLVTDDPEFTDRKECCSTVRKGDQTVLHVCAEELEFMLGKEGFDELVRHNSDRT